MKADGSPITPPSQRHSLTFFDGNPKVELPKLPLTATAPFTLEVWAARNPKFAEWPGTAISVRGVGALHSAGNYKGWSFDPAGGRTPARSAIGPSSRVHLAGVFTGKESLLFVDGKLVDRKPASPFAGAKDARQGEGLIGYNWVGAINQVRVSNSVRYDQDFMPEGVLQPDKDTVALYRFDEGTGDVLKDSSGNNHHGKIVGAKWVKVEPPPPPTNYALEFDGKSSYVEIPTLERDKPESLTLEAWVRSKSEASGVIVRMEGRAPAQVYLGVGVGLGGLEESSQARHRKIEPASKLSADAVNHVAYVIDERASKLFVNGVRVGLVARTSATPLSQPGFRGTWLGAQPHIKNQGQLAYFFAGVLDEVRISKVARYDKDFTPDVRFTSDKDTLALYHFDEGAGSELKDSSGNNHHGKIVGAKWVKVDGAPIAPQSAIGLAPPIAMVPFGAAHTDGAMQDVVVNSIGIKLLRIPRGKFVMGGPLTEKNRIPKEAQVTVTLSKDFWLGQTEVTNAQWKRVMGSVPSHWKDDDGPVEQVSWDDSIDFCKKLSELPEERKSGRVYRLPTEAEWEYACRAGTETVYSFGDDETLLGDFGWFDGNSDRQTHPVGQKKPNPWGLYDMHGNVWEWCSDWYGEYPIGVVTDPQGPSEGSSRVSRGGSWFNPARVCRSASRYRLGPSYRNDSMAFRLALSPSGAEPPEAAPSPSPAPVGVPKLLTTLKNSLGPGGMAFSGDGNNVIADGSNLTFFDALTGNVLHQEFKEKTLVTALSRAADGKALAYSGVGGDAFFTRVLELPSRKKIAEFSPRYVQLSGALSPDGKTLVYGDEAGLMFRDVLESRAEVAIKAVKDRLFTALKYSPDGQFVAGVYFDNSNHGKETQLVILDAKTRVQIAAKDLEGMSDWSDISKDSKRVVVATKMVGKPAWHLFSLPEGNLIHTERDLPAPCFAGAFSPDSAHLALGFFDGSVQIWDAATKKVILSWNATQHVDPKNKARAVVAVAFSPDGKTLATACNPDIHLWDLTKATTGTEPKP